MSLRAVCAIIVGLFSIIAYSVFSYVYFMQGVDKIRIRDYLPNFEKIIAIKAAYLIFNVLMVVISLVMIVGVARKRSGCVCPWLTLMPISIVWIIVDFIRFGFKTDSWSTYVYLSVIVANALVWFPIFSLWREWRRGTYSSQYSHQVGYYAAPQESQRVYTAVPQKV